MVVVSALICVVVNDLIWLPVRPLNCVVVRLAKIAVERLANWLDARAPMSVPENPPNCAAVKILNDDAPIALIVELVKASICADVIPRSWADVMPAICEAWKLPNCTVVSALNCVVKSAPTC